MLKQLSKFERTSKVLILGFVALMAVSLVLFFRPNSGSSGVEPTRSAEVVAPETLRHAWIIWCDVAGVWRLNTLGPECD